MSETRLQSKSAPRLTPKMRKVLGFVRDGHATQQLSGTYGYRGRRRTLCTLQDRGLIQIRWKTGEYLLTDAGREALS